MRLVGASVAIAVVFLAPSTRAATSGTPVPEAVSPGHKAGVARVGDVCPTFSWTAVPGAEWYELVAHVIGVAKGESREVLRQELPGGATSWTPSLEACLERSRRYAWSVRAKGDGGVTEWSAPSLFQVQTAERYAADIGAVPPEPGENLAALAPGDSDLTVNGSAVVTVGSTGTVLLFGRVRGENSPPVFSTGAYTTSGDPLPPITDIGTGTYLIGLPGGESFSYDRHGVVITPLEFGSERVARIEEGTGGTIHVVISDAAGTEIDEDFQIIVFND